MRVLVIGATGYVANRLISTLIEQGFEVVAGARSPEKLDDFWWADRVTRADIDVLDPHTLTAVTDGIDAVVYLVHGMGGSGFSARDREAAENVRAAIDGAGVERLVYLSGIIPPIPEEDLSEHLTSRLEVERILSRSSAVTVTLRAAMVIGAGSTSFELMSQLSERLPITVIPDWMTSAVEPIAVSDVVEAIIAALTVDVLTCAWDVGGGTVIAYPELIDRVARARGTQRPQLTVPLLPTALVGKVAGWIADVPAPTVEALIRSLREDMVTADARWRTELMGGNFAPVALDEAIDRALRPADQRVSPSQRDLLGHLPGDPDWAYSDTHREPVVGAPGSEE